MIYALAGVLTLVFVGIPLLTAPSTAIPAERAAVIRLRMNSLARRKTCTSSLITRAGLACGW